MKNQQTVTISKEEYENLKKIKLESDLLAISQLKGASKRKPITEEEYERVRQEAFEEISRDIETKTLKQRDLELKKKYSFWK